MTDIGSLPNLIGSGIEKYAPGNLASSEVNSTEMASQIASVGKEFESVFLSLMLKEMRNTLEGGFFGEETSDTYGGMFDMFVGQDLAESSPLGIAEMLSKSYAALQSDALAAMNDASRSAIVSAKYNYAEKENASVTKPESVSVII